MIPNRLRRWAAEDWLRRIAKNAGMVLLGNGAAAVFTALALILSARSLAPTAFGQLSLIAAYVGFADGLLNFQSWQALIRYGTEARARKDSHAIAQLLGYGLRLDLLHALVGSALACAAALVASDIFGWSAAITSLVVGYSATILLRITGTPVAVLRLFDRFGLVAVQTALQAALRFAFVTAAYLFDGSLPHFVLAWAAADVVGSVLLVILAARALRAAGVGIESPFRSGTAAAFPGLNSFVWVTNVHSSIKLAIKEGDVLVVGAVAGATAAGFYRIAKQVAAAMGKAVGPLYQAIYPELAAAVVDGDATRFRRMIYRPALIVSAFFLLLIASFAALGPFLIETLLGPSYEDVYGPTLLYLAGSLLSVASFALHPALLALHAPAKSLTVLMVSVALYMVVLPAAARWSGASGAAAAFILFYVVWTSLMSVVVMREWRKLNSRGA